MRESQRESEQREREQREREQRESEQRESEQKEGERIRAGSLLGNKRQVALSPAVSVHSSFP